jgi:hypothetical protein
VLCYVTSIAGLLLSCVLLLLVVRLDLAGLVSFDLIHAELLLQHILQCYGNRGATSGTLHTYAAPLQWSKAITNHLTFPAVVKHFANQQQILHNSPQSSKISLGLAPVGHARHSAAVRDPSLDTGRVPGHWLQVACLVTLFV